MCKMLDHIALLRAIKKKKKKNFSRPTDPVSRRASMDKQTIFFIGLSNLHAIICMILQDVNDKYDKKNFAICGHL